MDRRRLNHITAVFLAAVVLVVAFMLFHSFRSPPSLVLPEEQDSSQLPPDSGDQQEALGTVSVTPDTVQTAIATLERPEQYHRSICVEQYWDSGNGSWDTSISTNGTWIRIDRTLASGRVRHSITDGSITYIWYDSETRVFSSAADDITPDMEQNIPTYEDVLSLDPEQIAQADYQVTDDYGGCIFVETAPDEDGYALRYWVSLDSGLLAAAEKLQNGELIYHMWETALDLAPAFDGEFTLPNGQTLAK